MNAYHLPPVMTFDVLAKLRRMALDPPEEVHVRYSSGGHLSFLCDAADAGAWQTVHAYTMDCHRTALLALQQPNYRRPHVIIEGGGTLLAGSLEGVLAWGGRIIKGEGARVGLVEPATIGLWPFCGGRALADAFGPFGWIDICRSQACDLTRELPPPPMPLTPAEAVGWAEAFRWAWQNQTHRSMIQRAAWLQNAMAIRHSNRTRS